MCVGGGGGGGGWGGRAVTALGVFSNPFAFFVTYLKKDYLKKQTLRQI